MKKKQFKPKCVWVLLAPLLINVAYAKSDVSPRISAIHLDLSKPEIIKLAPNHVSYLIFKQPVSEVTSGNKKAIIADISEVNPNMVRLQLVQGGVPPTNLIVIYRGANKDPAVFELMPNWTVHRDVVKVVGVYGTPRIEGEERRLLYSSEPESKKEIYEN